MTPPAGPGQISVLQTHYAKAGDGPVAYIDETYHLENDGRARFYTLAAVIVTAQDRDPLRGDLDEIVPTGWWHTSQQLRTDQGHEDARELLRTLDSAYDACVIVDHIDLDPADHDGLQARGAAMRRLLLSLHHADHQQHDPVQLAVAEEHRLSRVNNFDRAIRQSLLDEGEVPETLGLVHASPGSEHLLWLPDLVCSAYRQAKLRRTTDLFDEIRDLTHVTTLSGDS